MAKSNSSTPLFSRRCKLEVVFDVLSSLYEGGGIGTYAIQRRANVNLTVLKETLDLLHERGLVEVQGCAGKRQFWKRTPDGTVLLSRYEELKRSLGWCPT